MSKVFYFGAVHLTEPLITAAAEWPRPYAECDSLTQTSRGFSPISPLIFTGGGTKRANVGLDFHHEQRIAQLS